jgi:opacity protein-like surface antigen
MKILFVLVCAGIVLFFGVGAASAQSLSAGVHGGVSLVRIDSDVAVDTEFLPKPVVGVHGDLAFLDELALHVAIEYAGKGGKVTTTQPGSPTAEYALDYIQIPVNLRYLLGAGPAEAYVLGGATLGFLTGATQTLALDTGPSETDVKDALSKVAVSLDIGAGIGYRVLPHATASLEVAYSLGLNEIAGTGPTLAVKSWKMTSVQILIGLTYNFGPARAVTPIPVTASLP